MSTRIQLRHDTAANWTAANPTLLSGECGVETDTHKFKTGDGTTAWNSLGYVGGSGTTGTPTHVVYFDGSGNPVGSANLTWNNTDQTLTVSMKDTYRGIDVYDHNGASAFYVRDRFGYSETSFGDVDQTYDGTGFFLNVFAKQILFSTTGVISLGDIAGFGTATLVTIDDANQKTTSNVKHEASGDIKLMVAGNGLYVKEGSNATMGTATLSGGTVVVSTTKVTANSRIQLTVQSLGTVAVPKAIGVTARTAATSFTITSADATDTSVVGWLLVEPS